MHSSPSMKKVITKAEAIIQSLHNYSCTAKEIQRLDTEWRTLLTKYPNSIYEAFSPQSIRRTTFKINKIMERHKKNNVFGLVLENEAMLMKTLRRKKMGEDKVNSFLSANSFLFNPQCLGCNETLNIDR